MPSRAALTGTLLGALAAATLLLVPRAVAAELAEKLPTVRLAYVFTSHHSPLIVALAKGEDFRDRGVYLRPVVPREKYVLVEDGKPVANVDIVVNKSGSETATLFAMDRLDLGLASVTAIMAGIDQGTAMKVVSPLQSDGSALVFPRRSAIDGWEKLLAHVRAAREPVRIGYHSPTSAPRILLEGALKHAGVRVTTDASDAKAQVLLVDLKTTANLSSALVSGQVDGWVGPSPFPEVAAVNGTGRVVVDLRDLPPHGHWNDFPCCILAGRDAYMKEHPRATAATVRLVHEATRWVAANKAEADALTAEWIGIPVEAANRSRMTFTTSPSANWFRGTGMYLDLLNAMDKFTGPLKGKRQDDVKPLLFDFAAAERR